MFIDICYNINVIMCTMCVYLLDIVCDSLIAVVSIGKIRRKLVLRYVESHFNIRAT